MGDFVLALTRLPWNAGGWGMRDLLACTSFSLLWQFWGRAWDGRVDRVGGSVQAARGWMVG
jgi:hypothetical protein